MLTKTPLYLGDRGNTSLLTFGHWHDVEKSTARIPVGGQIVGNLGGRAGANDSVVGDSGHVALLGLGVPLADDFLRLFAIDAEAAVLGG